MDLGEGALGGEVAGMDEDVAVGEGGLAVVGVGDADDAGVVGGFVGGWVRRECRYFAARRLRWPGRVIWDMGMLIVGSVRWCNWRLVGCG